jgi:DNA-directed RNA polymerase subunit beta
MPIRSLLPIRDFSKVKTELIAPSMLDIQVKSYERFLQQEVAPEKRKNDGLQAVFSEIFPISDIHNRFTLEFVKYSLGEPKYSILECMERDMSYAVPLRATLRLVLKDPANNQEVKDIIEQVVYLGEIPLMTASGNYIINGAERVIVSQLHRSPGVIFSETTHPNGKVLNSARIVPYRGSWIEFVYNIKDILYVSIDRRRKFPCTVLLRAIGYPTDDDILSLFQETESVAVSESSETCKNRVVAETIIDQETGEIIIERCQKIAAPALKKLLKNEIKKIKVFVSSDIKHIELLQQTLGKDNTHNREEALTEIYKILRPGEPPNMEVAQSLIEKLFFDPKRYDIGEVGRFRMNERLDLKTPYTKTTLDPADIVEIIRYLLYLRIGKGRIDDIDHLGNRRVRTVGELVANEYSVGLSRMARTIKERMALYGEGETVTPQDLVNARIISSVIFTFFGSSQLSQFMDQTNPLSELTHKRRLSALGPGGLSRERAGFEVRDVHHSHYGRICPVETPEGPNIGLIASLSSFAEVNRFGFIETPYRKVTNGKVTETVEFLSADREDKFIIAQATTSTDANGKLMGDAIKARHLGDFPLVLPGDINYMDVSCDQLVSVSAALVPFLEHDDANRALMGSNMQRQAVPLLVTEAPLVGTGIERKVAVDSGAVVTARGNGVVEFVDSTQVVINPTQAEKSREWYSPVFERKHVYPLRKYLRSNQNTSVNQRPLVRVGQAVRKGEVIADGAGTDRGELALGKNVLVAFLPWNGYNFEDAIILSERLVKDDTFTSVHIEEMTTQARDTKRGIEEITKEIPNVSEEALAHLDESGVVMVGAEVKPGDILVGKITPKGKTELSPEEMLLRSIFGERAGEVSDTSLKVPPGIEGIVLETKVFSSKVRDEKTKKSDRAQILKLEKEMNLKIREIKEHRDAYLREVLTDQSAGDLKSIETNRKVSIGNRYAKNVLAKIDFDRVIPVESGQWSGNPAINKKVEEVFSKAIELIANVEAEFENNKEKILRGDELPPGVVKLVKVYIAKKCKIAVGDKMAGRHGNKGVVARVVAAEDLPYLPDGTPVDIVLNPLGVPSRMNVGQILETHLGWAAKILGFQAKTPVFNGVSVPEIKKLLAEAHLPASGKSVLYDGRTGDPFDCEVTVGYIYMMKLAHLAGDKIHARSIGPYSLITQQPLGGKAQFGGQRFGEMEVWALEAYGAAYALQEMLTIKSDDVEGRLKAYEAIVKGENPPRPGIPESFNVLIKELQSLGMDVRFEKEEK